MHTTTVKDDQNHEWVINHNSDWSGPAHVTRYDEKGHSVERYILPGCLFREACREDVARGMISALEQKFL